MEAAQKQAFGPLSLTPEQFGNFTPAEINEMVAGYEERRRIAQDDLITLAWQIEAMARHKKLPKLQTLLSKQGQPKKKVYKAEDLAKLWDAARAKGLATPLDTAE